MSRTRSRRRVFATLVTSVVLVGSGIAVAYWSVTGTGQGSAATGDNEAITINQTSTVRDLRPGGAPQPLRGNFTNDNVGPVYVTSVTATIESVTKAADAPTGTCDATDYLLEDAEMTVGVEVPSGTAVGSWRGASLSFNNKADANQDACKGATVTIGYESD